MAEAAQTEFWRDLKPIDNVFRTYALPEMYTPDIASDDERYYVPLSETVGTRPIWISVSQNSWCDVLMSTGPGLVNRHYHPHEVKVKGPLIWLDENGDVVDFFDVHHYIEICKAHYEKVGLGADLIDSLLR